MVSSNEELAELEHLQRQRWNWVGVLLLGVVLVIGAASSGAGWLAVIGVAVGALGAVMRGNATKRVQLVEARIKDRATGRTPA